MKNLIVVLLISSLSITACAQDGVKIPFAIKSAVRMYEAGVAEEREKLLQCAGGGVVAPGDKLPANLSKAVEAYDTAVAKHKAKLLHVIASSKAAVMSKNGNDDDLASLGRYAEKVKSQKELTGRAILEGGKDELSVKRDKEKEADAEASSPFIGSWIHTSSSARLEILEGGACNHSEFGGGSWSLKSSKIILKWRKSEMARGTYPNPPPGDVTISLIVGRVKDMLEGTGINAVPVFFKRATDGRGEGNVAAREYAVDVTPRPSARRHAGASGCLSAPDASTLSPGAQKLVDDYNVTIKNEKEKVLRTLQAELVNETQNGNLDEALILRDAVRGYQREDSYLITPQPIGGTSPHRRVGESATSGDPNGGFDPAEFDKVSRAAELRRSAEAVDAKLTPDAQKAVGEFKAILKREREKIVQALQAEMTSETKKGNLDGAVAIRNVIQPLKEQKAAAGSR